MKYMGSKRKMLQNGLGELIGREIDSAHRFVDLFAGSGSVATYVAREFPIQVVAFDLQSYSVILTSAVVGRRSPFLWHPVWRNWLGRAALRFEAFRIPSVNKITQSLVASARIWCDEQTDLPITKAYGGHYFSPRQAVWIDSLRSSLPRWEPARTVTLASLIQATSLCSAAPGHTAQPFQPSPTAIRYIEEAWNKDIVEKTRTALGSLAGQFAQRHGHARIGDANEMARRLRERDLAFIDPPYSGVQYSRFYHVLETIAHGTCGAVTGVGRYPARETRPRSQYSLVSESVGALEELLRIVAARCARAVVTFPNHKCSNGLSGDIVREIAMKYFSVSEHQVASKFSTLGGTGDDRGNEAGRSALMQAQELILILRPR